MSAASASFPLIQMPEEFSELGAPLISTESVPLCPVCQSEMYTDFALGYDYELRTCRNPWRFVKCTACGHVWLNPRPGVTELSVIYPSTYYAYNYGKINPVARRAKEWLDHRKISSIVQRCKRLPHTYVDVGCGDGRYLRTLENFGVPRRDLYGLELDQQVVGRLRSQGYSGVFCERVEDSQDVPEGAIDLATMFHVIEHVDNPAAVIRKVQCWLAPGGVFALETPNLDSLDARIFGHTYWGGYHIPRHWNLFTPATISRLLEQNGLKVVDIIFQTGHSFWMYSLHHVVRYKKGSRPRLGGLFDPMKSLFGIAAFTGFDLLRSAVGSKTSAMLVISRRL